MANPSCPRTEMHGPVRGPLDGACYMAIRSALYVTHDLSTWVRVSLDNEAEVRRAVNLLSYLHLPIPPRS